MKVKSNVKAGNNGRIIMNHNQSVKGLHVKSSVKAGGRGLNHNQTARGLRVKSKVKAGTDRIITNHNQMVRKGLSVKSGVKAGGRSLNHSQSVTLAA